MIFFFILSIVHLVFYFFIKQTDFGNIFDVFESSPLFNFSVKKDCAGKSHITFHVWEGREKTSYYYYGGSLKTETKIVDVTNIDKINGYFFVTIIYHIKIYYIMDKLKKNVQVFTHKIVE